LQEFLSAKLTPRAVPAATLAAYAGVYEGPRTFTVEDGHLVYRPRPGFPPDTLVALSDSVFARGVTRIGFEHDTHGGTLVRLTVPERGSLTFPRLARGTPDAKTRRDTVKHRVSDIRRQ
jgi:hypothetical protein